MSVLDLPRLLATILQLQCSCAVDRSGYGSHGAWASGGLVVGMLLNGSGMWVVWMVLNGGGVWVVSPSS